MTEQNGVMNWTSFRSWLTLMIAIIGLNTTVLLYVASFKTDVAVLRATQEAQAKEIFALDTLTKERISLLTLTGTTLAREDHDKILTLERNQAETKEALIRIEKKQDEGNALILRHIQGPDTSTLN